MKNIARITAFVGVVASAGVVSSAWGQVESTKPKLGGRIFAVTGEYLFVAANIGLPFTAGETFQNCYTFQEDTTPGEEPMSGVWNDPVFPAPGEAVPGIWVQHTKNPAMLYTAISEDGAGVTLTQNGTVKSVFAPRSVRLTAYSTAHVAGLGVVISVLSNGYQVEECPYELP